MHGISVVRGIFYAGDVNLIGVWEAAAFKNYNENAWPRRWSLLDDNLCLFSRHIHSIHYMLDDIWVSNRYLNHWHILLMLYFFLIEQVSELFLLVGLKFFRFNDYSIQFIFYFLCINLQISIAFLVSSAFSKIETASGTNLSHTLTKCISR